MSRDSWQEGQENFEQQENYWKIKGKESVSLGRFKIHHDRILTAENKETFYSYVDIKTGVCILPVKNSETPTSEREVVIIKQYRHSLKKWEYELPAGMVDTEESPEEAARRELTEETGYEAGKLTSLGYFYPSAGSTNEKIYLFLAENLTRQEQETDTGEEIETINISLQKLKTMIVSNEFNHGAGLALICRYLLG